MPWICSVSSSMPGGRQDLHATACASATSISISLSSSLPSRSVLRNSWRAVLSAAGVVAEAELGARAGQQRVEDALLGGVLGARRAALRISCSRACFDRDLDQVADDRVDVAADVADLGELGRLDLDEGRVGEPRQAARDLGLADAGGADHEDVLRRDLAAQRLGDLLRGASGCAARSPPRAWRRPGRRCAVELGDDLLRRHRRLHGRRTGSHPSVSIDVVLVGVDAEVAGDLERALHDLGGRQLGVLQQRERRGLRVARRRGRWRRGRARARARRRCR